jgi:hypothetical protein
VISFPPPFIPPVHSFSFVALAVLCLLCSSRDSSLVITM